MNRAQQTGAGCKTDDRPRRSKMHPKMCWPRRPKMCSKMYWRSAPAVALRPLTVLGGPRQTVKGFLFIFDFVGLTDRRVFGF